MKDGRFISGLLGLSLFCTAATGQTPFPLPVLNDKPTPQVDAGGPSATVSSLAFGVDGETVYAGGLDKVVRVWRKQNGSFALIATYRVPIGPGNMGAINAMALSPDGKWLGMAGRAPIRSESLRLRVIIEGAALSPEQNMDAGVIYVASTANPAGGKVLRGHRGEVRALAFAPFQKGKPALLVSAATERDGARRLGGLRLWDVDAGKLLAECTDLPANTARPGLAVWHTGPSTSRVRVAVAWREEDSKKQSYLRLWDPSPGADRLQRWEDDRGTQTVALLGQDDGVKLLTGGFGGQAGRLQVWNVSANRQITPGLGPEILFPKRGQDYFLPVCMSLVSARGAYPSHAAVVVLPFRGPRPADANSRLALVDLGTNQVVADVELVGSDRFWLPTIATCNGRIAVAATRDHAVRVYAVADLLAGKYGPKAVLAGDGLSLRQAAFVDRGRGLWLSVDKEASAKGLAGASGVYGDLVLDLDKRVLRANQGVVPAKDTPEPGEWSLVIDPDRKTVRVRRGQINLPAVHLRKEQEVTSAELRPPAPGRPAVLAVAYIERKADRAVILLCDPEDGKPYRQLIGHLQRVNQLAFSASRPLLVSVGDDQTVCVWSLADLDAGLGQSPGLFVSQEGKKVVIHRVEPGSAAAKAGLAEGDVLEKVGAPGGKVKLVRGAADFLLAASAIRPGDELEVTVTGKGVVKLPVDRGVDERQPLFSLLLLRGHGLPEWIAWSPAGPYDCSSPAAEKHLGWHTNTGDPAAPVSYAPARDYRKEYYREGILRYLTAEGDLGRAVQEWNNAANQPSQVGLQRLPMPLGPHVPRVRFISPSAPETARRPQYTVSFRVESERPLERVEIRRDYEVLYRADLKKVEREGRLHVLQGDAFLELRRGTNNLELVAISTEGRSPRTEVVVSYTEPAVLVSIDQVESLAKDGRVEQVLKPVYGANAHVNFPQAAPRSLVMLGGRVRWSDPNAKALNDPGQEVVAKVGDCRQFPVALVPRGMGAQANVRRFFVPLVLTGHKNSIKIAVRSVDQEELGRAEIDLPCSAPLEAQQRLHLLIVAVDIKDGKQLEKRVLEALAVDPKDRPVQGVQGMFYKCPPFEECYVYPVLAGEVDRPMVEAQLVEINNKIKRLKRETAWHNDLVVVYYQGEDVIVPRKNERWLKTSPNFRYPKVPVHHFAIPCHALQQLPGTLLLLLNVTGTSNTLATQYDWGIDPDIGFLRYTSHDPEELRTANPALLGLLREAIRKRGRLGEAVKYLNDSLGQEPRKSDGSPQ
jgi:WD40 repeat protein